MRRILFYLNGACAILNAAVFITNADPISGGLAIANGVCAILAAPGRRDSE